MFEQKISSQSSGGDSIGWISAVRPIYCFGFFSQSSESETVQKRVFRGLRAPNFFYKLQDMLA